MELLNYIIKEFNYYESRISEYRTQIGTCKDDPEKMERLLIDHSQFQGYRYAFKDMLKKVCELHASGDLPLN